MWMDFYANKLSFFFFGSWNDKMIIPKILQIILMILRLYSYISSSLLLPIENLFRYFIYSQPIFIV